MPQLFYFHSSKWKFKYNDSGFSHGGANGNHNPSLSRLDSEEEAPVHVIDCYSEPGSRTVDIKNRSPQTFDHALEFEIDSLASRRSNGLEDKFRDPITASHANPSYSPATHGTEKMRISKGIVPTENADIPFALKSDEDSSRMHVFCLEHAVEVEQQLHQIGGVHVFLLCHPGRFWHSLYPIEYFHINLHSSSSPFPKRKKMGYTIFCKVMCIPLCFRYLMQLFLDDTA